MIVHGGVDAVSTLDSVVPFPLTVWLPDPFWQAAMTLRAGAKTESVTAIAVNHRVQDTNHLTFLKRTCSVTGLSCYG